MMTDISVSIAKEATKWIGKWFQSTIIEGQIFDKHHQPLEGVQVLLGESNDTTALNGKFILQNPTTGQQNLALSWQGELFPKVDQLYIEKGDRLQVSITLPFSLNDTKAIQQPNKKQSDWACPSCGYHNFASRSTCRDCHTQRPATHTPPTKPGDWACTDCGYHNFASRGTCRNCQTKQPTR